MIKLNQYNALSCLEWFQVPESEIGRFDVQKTI